MAMPLNRDTISIANDRSSASDEVIQTDAPAKSVPSLSVGVSSRDAEATEISGQTSLSLNSETSVERATEAPPLREAPVVGAVTGAVEDRVPLPTAKTTAEQLAVTPPDHFTSETVQSEFVSEEPLEVEEEPIEKGISVITREATVLGDIITEGHIDIVGRVKGNIDAKGDVAIHGIVRGDVDGSKIGLYSCRVKGNLNAGLGVIVDDNSIIGGDVKTKNIIFDGKVKGNIDADNVVVLRSHSYCLGDVSAASLAVEPGAILNGKIRTFVEGDLEAPFDEVM
jgi:cytoskeletal protein CcmA (bactofilin family)